MKICFLYGNQRALLLAERLSAEGNEVILCTTELETLLSLGDGFDLVVSFTYRHRIPLRVINEVGGNAVNIHISFLPWNRGADPNIWSWIENTPKGVTVHYITEKLDAGDIIAQRMVPMEESETLESSYCKLMANAEQLFMDIFPFHSRWSEMRKKALGRGSYHRLTDLQSIRSKIDYSEPIESFLRRLQSR